MLHRYRDKGRASAADSDRVIGVLEAWVSDDANTIPGLVPTPDESEDPFTKTTVLPPDSGVQVGDSDDRLQVGSVLRDRFMLQELVAGGSMGAVYKALDRRLAEVDGVDPWVAIKVLSPQLAGNAQALRALQQEAAKGRCLTHPNIVRFIDFDREDDLYFIVMEWLEGRSLAAVLDVGDGRPDLATSLEIVRQVGAALSYAHRCGVVHADVKPANIMVLPSGTVKLYDFGIARVRQRHANGDPQFDPGVLGAVTPAYSSMQVLTGEEPTVADDVFSLACLAYRLIAGHRVFGPRNAAEAAENGMEPQRPSGVSDVQWKALRKALSHSRVARYASTAEFVEALLAKTKRAPATQDDPPLTIPDEEIVERRFDERRRRWPYLLVVPLMAAVAVTLLRPAWVSEAVAVAEEWLGFEMPFVPLPAARAPESDATPASAADDAPDAAGTEPGAAETGPDETGPAGTGPAPGEPAAEEPADGAEPEPAVAPGAAAAEDDAATAADGGRLADEPGAEGAVAGGTDAIDEARTPADDETIRNVGAAPGNHGLVLAAPGEARPELDLTLREGEEPLELEVHRWFGLGEPLTVRIDEVGFSGNRSPRDAGQYTLSGAGVLSFDPGQRNARLEIAMPEDSEREADQQVALLLRDYYNANSELGMLNLSLLDDDQRAFEANHPANTVAFASDRVSVAERDPAVQIDILRLNPDRRTLTVRYRVDDVSATDGEDFFSPGRQSVTFGPGQRMARLLIPLVQDSLPESDESFALELDGPGVPEGESNLFRRITVIIRDDD